MTKKWGLLLVLFSSVAFTFLFHRQFLGLNLFIAEFSLFIYLLITKQFQFKKLIPSVIGLGLLTTSVFTIVTHSVFSYILNFTSLFIFSGTLIYPGARSLLSSIGLSYSNLVGAQIKFVQELTSSRINGRKIGGFLWKSRIFTIPIFIIALFFIIYRFANPVFDQLATNIITSIQERLNVWFRGIDFGVILTFLLGLYFCNLFFFRRADQKLIQYDDQASDVLERIKIKAKRFFNTLALKHEYKAGIFLLATLNAILLILNVIDVSWVWFNFEWEGQYLKQFVHEGTYLLILSILISVVIVLYYFRGNLNFYGNNKWLKYLSYTWLAQNGILTLSVAIRNFYYIEHFSLAYKRIGVILFLLLTIYGLYTVFRKVKDRRTNFYLLKANLLAIYIVLTVSACINWDSLIAKYNFAHADKSFLHLDYLATLSDKALPYLDKSMAELSQMDAVQKGKFQFEQQYMTPETYHRIIAERKSLFIQRWESKSILSWNLAEYLAYRAILEE